MDARPELLPFAPPPPEFDDLIEGENRQILLAARALALNDGSSSSLYVWGGNGGGKTCLLRAAVCKARESAAAFYVGTTDDIPPPMPGLLALDDVHRMSDDNRLVLFDWQNKIKPGANYRILAAADGPPAQAGVGEEIAARFSAGLVFRLREMSEEEKRRALSRYARSRGFALPEKVLNLLLTRLPRDMTSLTAALADLDSFLLAHQKPLTSHSAGKWLQSRPPPLLGTATT